MFNFGKIDYWGDAIPHRPAELSYIKQIPLPIESIPRRAKINARCIDKMTILQPSLPTRKQYQHVLTLIHYMPVALSVLFNRPDQIRESNYIRRTDQIHNQGFVSSNEQPYKEIGHPVYLENRKLISDALGLPVQESEEHQDKPSTPSSTIDDGHGESSPYMMRRSRKQLNTLRKEMERGRNLLRNVKLGHGLFKVLQDERKKLISRREMDEALAKQRAMMNWQAAHTGSDSESSSDDEIGVEFDITKEFVHIDVPEYGEREEISTDDVEHVKFQQRPETHIGYTSPANTDRNDVVQRRTASPLAIRRKKCNIPRPFTPLNNNISQKKQTAASFLGESLFKQLCCLHWLLKSMDLPDVATMTPIITCWQMNADKMGGIEINKKAAEDKKQRDQQRYDNLFKVPRQKEIRKLKPRSEKRRSTFFPTRLSRDGSIVQSTRSRSGSLAHSQTSEVMSSINDGTLLALDDSRLVIPETSMAAEDVSPNSLQVVSGASQNSTNSTEIELTTNDKISIRLPTTGLLHSSIQLSKDELKQQELARQLEEAAKADSTPMERLSHSRKYRATANVKPKSSKELLEFKASCKSSKLINKSKDLKQSWAEVKEEKALRLHDELDYQEKNRLKTCEDKFSAMKTSENSYHRALKNMRLQSEHMRKESEKEKNKKQDQSKYAKWFDDLVNMVPKECSSQWYFKVILDKLRLFGIKYGPDNKTESSSKASEHKFTKVLKFIRSWEICSPNIASAVEFCRDRIIEMNEEDFEELLQHLFPTTERPKTAPVKSARGSHI